MGVYGRYEDTPILAELYDGVPGYANRPDRDFYLECCRTRGGMVLELGCGTGRTLLLAAATGCRITGIDLSEHMLARCRQKLRRMPEDAQGRVRLVQAGMTDFDLEDRFCLAIIPFHTFQHLIAVEDQVNCLRMVNRHLEPGGKLVFDVFNVNLRAIVDPMLGEEIAADREIELPDRRLLRRSHRVVAVHRAEQYADVEIIFYLTDTGGTERIVQAFPFRHFYRYEVIHLLARCGFTVVDTFGSFDKSPLADDSPEMIFVAEKCDDRDY